MKQFFSEKIGPGPKSSVEQNFRDISFDGLSRKFCSGENFVPGPIFSGKIVPVRNKIF